MPGWPPVVDVGAHVQLGEAREPGQRRGAPHAQAGYHDGGNTEPGLALPQVSTPQLARSTVEKRDVSLVGLYVEAHEVCSPRMNVGTSHRSGVGQSPSSGPVPGLR
jgi:hypothetical protein